MRLPSPDAIEAAGRLSEARRADVFPHAPRGIGVHEIDLCVRTGMIEVPANE